MKRFLIIQTAFIGDAILATPLIEKLHSFFPDAKIDLLIRKGNESLFENHPFVNKYLIWNKSNNKYSNLIKIIKQIRGNKYDYVINLQRFATTGIITALSSGKIKIGFNKNPLSFLFNLSVKHIINVSHLSNMKHSRINPQLDTRIEPLGIHERDRNLSLINSFTDNSLFPVRLYPSDNDFNSISKYVCENYICIAPASVWFTKQFPSDKWIDFILKIPSHYKIYLIGGNNDCEVCLQIINKIKTISYDTADIINLAGKLSLLQTAALMKNAKMNYVNDSAPLHLASSVNAPVTAIFCSTVPAFGFGPLSDNSHIIETKDNLYCRPCGLHGFKKCPQNHFKCAINITSEQLLKTLIL